MDGVSDGVKSMAREAFGTMQTLDKVEALGS